MNKNCADSSIEVEKPTEAQATVSTLEKVKTTIKGLYARMVRSFKTMLGYIKTKLRRKETEDV